MLAARHDDDDDDEGTGDINLRDITLQNII